MLADSVSEQQVSIQERTKKFAVRVIERMTDKSSKSMGSSDEILYTGVEAFGIAMSVEV